MENVAKLNNNNKEVTRLVFTLLYCISYLICFMFFFFFICFKVDSTKYVTMLFNIIQSTLPKSILHFTWIHSQKWKKYDSNKKWKIICSKSKHKHKFYGAVFFSYCKFEHNETREKNKYNFILWKERKLQNDCVILKWNKLSSKRQQQKEREKWITSVAVIYEKNTNGINSFALLLCLFICYNMERTLNYLIKK